MGDTVQVKGLEELQRKLLELPLRVEKKIVRGAVVAGAQRIRDNARERAPVYAGTLPPDQPPPGTLKKSIIMRFAQERSRGTQATYLVVVRHGPAQQKVGKKGVNRDAWYWSLVEFGHFTRHSGDNLSHHNSKRDIQLAHLTASGGIKWVPGVAFMRNAFHTQKDAAAALIIEGLKVGIGKEVRDMR